MAIVSSLGTLPAGTCLTQSICLSPNTTRT